MATVSLASGMVLKPTATREATTDSYVSSLTTNSIHVRDVDERLIKRYGDQGITGLLELLGNKKETNQTTFEHFEEAFYHNSLTVQFASAAAAAAKTDEILTVQSGSLAGGTAEKHPVRNGDILMLQDGTLVYVAGINANEGGVSLSASQISIHPLTTFKTAFATGTDYECSIVGNMFAEGSVQPTGISPDLHEYNNTVMILKESFEVTGSEATNVVYFKVENENMGSGYLWYLKGEQDTYKRFMDYSEIMMVVGEAVTNDTSVTDSYGNAAALNTTFKGTEGLLPFIENNGQSMDLGASSITMADFDAIVKSLDKYRGAKENALYAGINLSLDVDDLLASQTAVSAGGANYGTFNNSKDVAIQLGFNSFTRGGYTFHKKTYDLFNHPKLLAASAAFNFPGYGMIIPMDTRRDAKSGESIPSLRIRYKAVPGYSREMEHWLTGSAVLKNKTNTTDKLLSHYRTERGFEGFAANRYMLIKKS